MPWYNTSTVSVTNNSATVTGAATAWVANAAAGMGFVGPDFSLYEIQSVNSDTSLTLAKVYRGSTASGQSYALMPTQDYIRTLASQVATLISTYSTIATAAGAGKFGDGTAASPGITFGANTNTGVYRPGANVLGLATNGVSALVVDGSQNVGVGTTSPTAVLDVVKASYSGGPLLGARFSASNYRMGIGIGNANGFPFLGVNVNNAANDNGTFDINGYAHRLRMENGQTQFQLSSASGTPGGAITWTTQMLLDASGNVGVAVTPSAWGSNRKAIQNGSASFASVTGSNSFMELSANRYINSSSQDIYIASDNATTYQQAGGSHRFCTAPSGTAGASITFSQAMTLDSAGSLLIKTTTSGSLASGGIIFNPSGDISLGNLAAASGTAFCSFLRSNVVIGSITQSGTTAILYNTTSDQRLKTSIQDAPDAAALIDSIKVRSFDWLADGSHQRYGMVAQELHAVAPEAVHAPADPDAMMAVDYSKLVPMLIKEVQSLRARVAALEAA